MGRYEKAVNDGVTNVQLTQQQFDALVDFTFNVGPGAFAKSKLLKDVNAGNCDHDTILNDMLLYKTSGGQVLQGLIVRRNAEANLFSNGIYK